MSSYDLLSVPDTRSGRPVAFEKCAGDHFQRQDLFRPFEDGEHPRLDEIAVDLRSETALAKGLE